MLEPVVAYGARMSWCGVFRPGDSFPTPIRTRRVALVGTGDEPLRRAYGAWSQRAGRFALTLSDPGVRAELPAGDPAPRAGLDAFVHWVPSEALLGTGAGSVCEADGWPASLWSAFLAVRDRLSPVGIAAAFGQLADTALDEEPPVLAEWRGLVSGHAPTRGADGGLGAFRGWLPVPIDLRTGDGPSTALLSWSPSPTTFRSVSAAFDSLGPGARMKGLVAQLHRALV